MLKLWNMSNPIICIGIQFENSSITIKKKGRKIIAYNVVEGSYAHTDARISMLLYCGGNITRSGNT